MSRTRWLSAAIAALAIVVSVPLAEATSTSTSTSTVRAKLTGKAERGSKGDPNGSGTATVKVKSTQACFTLSYKSIDPPTSGHIHKGGSNAVGPPVVDLFIGKAKKSACVKVKTSKLAKDIVAHPSGYYVNLHNAKYPDGAIRGQLAK